MITSGLSEGDTERIRSVSDQVNVMCFGSTEEDLKAMPRVDVVLGRISRELFQRRKRLRWVQIGAAGVDGTLFSEFVESDVILTSAKGTVGVHLAEHSMALLLGLSRGIAWSVRKRNWDQRGPISNAAWELMDKTMGIVGLGDTGRELARRASGFGMRVIAVNPSRVEMPDCVEACWPLERFYELLGESDVVAICAPLTRETRGMFDREAFRKMRRHALLINVSRGKIVDEAALMEALERRLIGGAGLDVTPQEPLPQGHPLWSMENVIITPHSAGGSPNRADRFIQLFCENLRRFMAGETMLSVVDKQKGY